MWIKGIEPVKVKKGDIVGYRGECDTPFVILSPNKNETRRRLPSPEQDLGNSPVSIPCVIKNRQLIRLSDGVQKALLFLTNGLWHYQRFGANTPVVQLIPNTFFEIVRDE